MKFVKVEASREENQRVAEVREIFWETRTKFPPSSNDPTNRFDNWILRWRPFLKYHESHRYVPANLRDFAREDASAIFHVRKH